MVGHMVLRVARCYFLLIPIGARIPGRRARVMNINAVALALLTFLPLRVSSEMARPMMFREKGTSAWQSPARWGPSV